MKNNNFIKLSLKQSFKLSFSGQLITGQLITGQLKLTAKLSYFFIVISSILMPNLSASEGKFCYRHQGVLTCNANIEKISPQFRNNTFFVPKELEQKSVRRDSEGGRASIKDDTRIKDNHTSISKDSNVVNSSEIRGSTIKRDKPLSAESPLNTTTISTSEINTRAVEAYNNDVSAPINDSISSNSSNNTVNTTKDLNNNNSNFNSISELPPAKGYENRNTIKNDIDASETLKPELPNQSQNTNLDKPITASDPNASKPTASNPSNKIEIYVAQWCTHCKALEDFLNSKNISYSKFDVEKDPHAIKLFEEHGSVPISKIGPNIVVGFEPSRYGSIIEANLPY